MNPLFDHLSCLSEAYAVDIYIYIIETNYAGFYDLLTPLLLYMARDFGFCFEIRRFCFFKRDFRLQTEILECRFVVYYFEM